MIRLFSVFIPTSIVGLVVSETLLVVMCLLVSLGRQFGFDLLSFYLVEEGGWLRMVICVVAVVGGLYLNDCYSRLRMRSRIIFMQQLCLVFGFVFLLQAMFSYTDLDVRMPRQSMFMGSTLCVLVLPLWRGLYSKVLLQLPGDQTVFIGTHALQRVIATELLDRPEFGMHPVAVVTEEAGGETILAQLPVIGAVKEVPECLKAYEKGRMIVGLREEKVTQAIPQLVQLQQSHLRTENMNSIYELIFGRVAIAQLTPMQIMFNAELAPSGVKMRLQAIYSWLIAFVALILLAPVMVVAAIAVRLTSPGPILFRQTRTGLNNQTFLLYKFRSMRVDAEAATGAVWAQKNDPRVTPIGRFLRKYRVDELPQLFNVLRNEMAIVGPRPERPEFVGMLSEKVPFYGQRHCVKPGITGWAQINYKYGNTIEDTVVKLEYDLYYIKHFAPQLDFYIMFHTAKTMLLTRGAY